MRWLRNLLLRLVLPKSEEELKNWLAWMEAGCIVGGVFFLIYFTAFLLAGELLWAFKLGLLALVLLVFISTLNLLQYLLPIEFNSRKKRALRERLK
ncbi:MAG: hypothetical protein QXH27_01650 [Candidatus Micrarchaeia archaeon]